MEPTITLDTMQINLLKEFMAADKNLGIAGARLNATDDNDPSVNEVATAFDNAWAQRDSAARVFSYSVAAELK